MVVNDMHSDVCNILLRHDYYMMYSDEFILCMVLCGDFVCVIGCGNNIHVLSSLSILYNALYVP